MGHITTYPSFALFFPFGASAKSRTRTCSSSSTETARSSAEVAAGFEMSKLGDFSLPFVVMVSAWMRSSYFGM